MLQLRRICNKSNLQHFALQCTARAVHSPAHIGTEIPSAIPPTLAVARLSGRLSGGPGERAYNGSSRSLFSSSNEPRSGSMSSYRADEAVGVPEFLQVRLLERPAGELALAMGMAEAESCSSRALEVSPVTHCAGAVLRVMESAAAGCTTPAQLAAGTRTPGTPLECQQVCNQLPKPLARP